jgi:DNA invertase Pin-like site-specific DNA recombinase
MAVYGYVRSATGSVEHLDEQRRQIQAFFAARGGEVTGFFADSGSGNTRPTERPGYGEMYSGLERGDAVAVTDFVRIARDLAELVEAAKALDRMGVRLVIASNDRGVEG